MIERIRDKYWDERRPGFDMDRLEIYIPENILDAFLREHAQSFKYKEQLEPVDLMRDRRKYDKLLYKVFKAASIVLTDRQFEIFILRYKCFMKETDIATQLGVDQSYISNVLKASYLNIQLALRLTKRPPNKRRIKLCDLCNVIAKSCLVCIKKIRLCNDCKSKIVLCSQCKTSFKYKPNKRSNKRIENSHQT